MRSGPGAIPILRLLISVFLLCVPVLADDIVIDFLGPGFKVVGGKSLAQSNGTISYAGGAAPLVGQNINIGAAVGVNTPAHSGELFAVTGTQPATGLGALNFSTGNYVGKEAGFLSFAGGGSFEIWGAVPEMGLSHRKLLWGSLLGALVDAYGVVKLNILTGSDIKDPDLVSFFGLNPADTKFNFSGSIHSIGLTSMLTGAFSTIALGSTNISNAVVPEPGSMALLGTALILISLKLRKKLRKPEAPVV